MIQVSNDDVQRIIGRLEAQNIALTNLVAALTSKMERIETKIDDMDRILSEVKGGWRMLMIIGGASGAAGSGLTWLAQQFLAKS